MRLKKQGIGKGGKIVRRHSKKGPTSFLGIKKGEIGVWNELNLQKKLLKKRLCMCYVGGERQVWQGRCERCGPLPHSLHHLLLVLVLRLGQKIGKNKIKFREKKKGFILVKWWLIWWRGLERGWVLQTFDGAVKTKDHDPPFPCLWIFIHSFYSLPFLNNYPPFSFLRPLPPTAKDLKGNSSNVFRYILDIISNLFAF